MDVLFHDPIPAIIPTAQFRLPSHFKTFFDSAQFHVLTSIIVLTLPIALLLYLHHDYQCFLQLGPGGTPATPLGYAKIKILSLVSLRDPLRPIYIPPHFRPQRGYLSALPKREGKRPLIRGIAPQRQQTQRSTAAIYSKLALEIRKLAKDPANNLIERTSCFEKHSTGLFASTPMTRVCAGEICHAHPSDGSLHLSLHPADGRTLMENGWGERHPLAKGGWFRRFVPKEFMLVYAPRTEEEVDTVIKVVAASVWWVSGIDVLSPNLDKRIKGAHDLAISDESIAKAAAENECWSCRLHGCGQKPRDKMRGDA